MSDAKLAKASCLPQSKHRNIQRMRVYPRPQAPSNWADSRLVQRRDACEVVLADLRDESADFAGVLVLF
jgi:hypothetical protein